MYVKVTSDYNLSNALTLVAIGHIQASSTFLVQKGNSTAEKRPPLRNGPEMTQLIQTSE